MPKLSDSMADAVIIRWLVAPGDAFARGEALIEGETDKATVVYEAEADGTLDAIPVPQGAGGRAAGGAPGPRAPPAPGGGAGRGGGGNGAGCERTRRAVEGGWSGARAARRSRHR